MTICSRHDRARAAPSAFAVTQARQAVKFGCYHGFCRRGPTLRQASDQCESAAQRQRRGDSGPLSWLKSCFKDQRRIFSNPHMGGGDPRRDIPSRVDVQLGRRRILTHRRSCSPLGFPRSSGCELRAHHRRVGDSRDRELARGREFETLRPIRSSPLLDPARRVRRRGTDLPNFAMWCCPWSRFGGWNLCCRVPSALTWVGGVPGGGIAATGALRRYLRLSHRRWRA